MFCSFQYASLSSPSLNLFLSIIIGSVFLISLLDTVLIYENTSNFCVLIWCFVTLLNSFISSKSI